MLRLEETNVLGCDLPVDTESRVEWVDAAQSAVSWRHQPMGAEIKSIPDIVRYSLLRHSLLMLRKKTYNF